MIGLDTNVLVRYIVQDDARQAALATRLIESECSPDRPGMVNLIVLCELVWVLERGYGYKKSIVLDVLRQLLAASELLIERSDLAWRAAEEYEKGKADFSDYIIGGVNRALDVVRTYTLDKKAAKNEAFELLQ